MISKLGWGSAMVLLLVSTIPSFAADDKTGVDLFLGGGISEDPGDDDITGNVSFGAGYRINRYLAVGLEGFRIKFSDSGTRILAGPYAKAYPLYNKFANLYVRGGLGLGNFKDDSSMYSPDTRFNFSPFVAGGLELGYAAVALYGELSQHIHVRYARSSAHSDVFSMTIGLSLHFLKRW